MAKERISLEMSVRDIIIVMGGENPGALTACMTLMRHGAKVDPDNFLGGLGFLLLLDSLNIWEERIYMLWDNVCGRHTGKMIATLRAYQLGQLAGVSEQALNHAIDNRGDGINLDDVVIAVKSKLPNFNPEAVAA